MPTETWTTRRLLGWMTERFEGKDVDAPRVVAEMLLSHVLECERMRLYMEVDRPATQGELDTLRELVIRASDHEPVQYLVGRATFYAREFLVDRSTMIPQPCTEDLVEAVLAWLREHDRKESPRLADVGTGTGCIAISLALQLPRATVVATDVADDAVALARRNADKHGVAERIEFRTGSLLEPLSTEAPFDVICSNPPYISDAEWDGGLVQRAVREHVPERALRGGTDGLEFIRPLIEGAAARLAPPGLLAIEIADSEHDAVLALVKKETHLASGRVLQDYEGLSRILMADVIG